MSDRIKAWLTETKWVGELVERPKEDTRGWEKSSDPFMRKAGYYADMANRHADHIEELEALRDRLTEQIEGEIELQGQIAKLRAKLKRIEEWAARQGVDLNNNDIELYSLE